MRKGIFLLLIIILVTACTLCTAFASENTELEFFAPDKSSYVSLSSPYLTAVSENHRVVFDSEGFKVLGDDSYTVKSAQHFYDAVVHGDVLYAIKSDRTILAFDLKQRKEISTDLSSIEQIVRISLEGDALYILSGISIVKHDLISSTTSTISSDFVGKTVFETINGNLVYCTKVQSDKFLSCGSLSTKISDEASDIAVSDYAFTLTGSGTIGAYSKSDLTEICSLDLNYSVSDITAVCDKLYVTSANTDSVEVYVISDGKLVYDHSLCLSGSGDNKFSSPSSIFAHGTNVVIADKDNNRLQILTPNGAFHSRISNVTSPVSVVEYSGSYYVISSGSIKKTSGGSSTQYQEADGKTFSDLRTACVDSFGTVYAVDGDRIVYKNSTTAFRTFLNEKVIDIAVSPKGTVLYTLTSSKITAYDSLGTVIFSYDHSLDLSENARIDSDVNGNSFVLDGSSLYVFDRAIDGFSFKNELSLTYNGESVVCSDLSLSTDGKLYLSSALSHAVFTLNSSVTGAEKYDPTSFTPPVDVYLKQNLAKQAGYVRTEDKTTFAYDFAQSYENATVVPANTLLLLLSNEPVNGFYYVYLSGKGCFIPTSSVTPLQAEVFAPYDGFALSSTKIYKYPVIDSTTSFALEEISNGTSFLVVGSAGGYTSKAPSGNICSWNEILYNGKIYYIERNKIGQANPEPPVDYGYAKLLSETVGGKVSVYALPDDSSAVLGEYADGTEVKLLTRLESTSTYTEVKIGDITGYVKTNQLTTNGLTTAQIVVLILVLVGGACSVTLLVISRRMHRSK